MKILNKFLVALLTVILLLSANFTIVLAAAEDGIGTEANPYLIHTAEELQNINNDVSAHYKLAADIDLQEMDFTPIGNTDTGAFTGLFDGEGYTISNLNVFAGKYAGLFGYNEGTIKNVTLSDVYVYGTQYIGAVVAYNSDIGVIENCSVLSGDVETDGGLLNSVYVGGVCAYSGGSMEGSFSNAADINASGARIHCVGGIGGYISTIVDFNAFNKGDLTAESDITCLVGGIGGHFSVSSTITDCYNTGSISASSLTTSGEYSYAGGIGGRFYGNITITDCYNTGSVSASSIILPSSLYSTDVYSYAGGIGGHFSLSSTITNCYNTASIFASTSCQNSSTSSGSYSYSGGISGQFLNSAITYCYNSGSVSASATAPGDSYNYLGGISGIAKQAVFNNCYNSGKLSSKSDCYAGGISGYSDSGTEFINCNNFSSISLTGTRRGGTIGAAQEAGGITGYGSDVTYYNCKNYGKITSYGGKSLLLGGISGNAENSNIEKCYNAADISASEGTVTQSGGILGYANNVNLKNSANTGNIKSISANDYKYSDNYAGGFIAYSNSNTNLECCYNSGFIYSRSAYYYGIGSFTGTGTSKAVNCYDIGFSNIPKNNFDTMKNCYTLSCYGNETSGGSNYKSTLFLNENNSIGNEAKNILTLEQMKDSSSFKGWDFEETWDIAPYINGGLPYLREAYNPLSLNVVAHTMMLGESYQFTAYKDGTVCTDVSWGVYDSTSISKNGVFTPQSVGTFVVYALDSDSNRACAVVRVMNKNTSVSRSDFSVRVDSHSSIAVSFGGTPTGANSYDYLVDVKSSNPEVFKINDLNENAFNYSALSAGKSTLTIKTAQGLTCSCVVTVTNSATAISLNYSSVTIDRGSTKQLTAAVTPNPTSSTVTWTSSDTNVATVDEYGLVHAVGKGTATITCKTNNGYSASCTVTVKAPATEIVFDEPEVTIYVGDTKELTFTVTPADTTDGISSITTSNTSYLPIQTWNSCSCTVKGVSTGTQTITVKMSNGLTATCKVKVLPVPVVVTSVSLNATSRAMLVGEKYKLNATIYPSNSTDKSVEWTSTDETVATVSDTGYITAVGAGETVITASASNGVVAHCTVTVTDPANNKLPIIFVPDTIVTDGEYFDIPIMLENNPGINKAVFSVQYDASKVEPISVTNGEIFDYTTATTNKEESKVNLYFTADTDKYANGVLATLKFKILVPDAGDAEFKLCYTPNDFISSTQEKVEFETEDGVAVIACSHNNTEIRNAVENSCTTNGYTGDKYCLDCKKIVVEGAVILSTGHEWNDWHTTVEPTFTTDGNTARTCATCGETENEVIEQLTNAKVTEGFIYGLSCGLTVQEFEKQFNSDYVNINIEPSFGTTIGTGSTVTATYANGTSDTLTVVIFGDVNGDGWYDGDDAFLVNMIVVGMLSEDNCSQALCIAADCNRDGVINETDVDLLMGAGVKKNDIDQSIPHEELAVNSSFIEYSSLINQSTELIIDSENQTTESESTPVNSDSEISFDSAEKSVQEITTENIGVNVFWGIFKKIFSFILQLLNLI